MNLRTFGTNIAAHELLHLISGTIIAFFIYRRFRSLKLVLIVFAVTFLIDLDHLTEAFFIYGLRPLEILSNFQGNFFREAGKMTILFHSWEVLPIILFLGRKFQKFPLAMAIALAATGHYLTDQLVYTSLYGMPILEYSLIFRVVHHFSFWELCGGC